MATFKTVSDVRVKLVDQGAETEAWGDHPLSRGVIRGNSPGLKRTRESF